MEFIVEFLPVTISVSTFVYGILFSGPSSRSLVEVSKKVDDTAKSKSESKLSSQALDDSKTAIPTKLQSDSGFSKRLYSGLSKTRGDIWKKIGALLSKNKLSEEAIEEIEEILYSSDMSTSMVAELIEELKSTRDKGDGQEATINDYLLAIKKFMHSRMVEGQQSASSDLYDVSKKGPGTRVIMVVGVNGAGKTTTIGKLATKLKAQGAKVVVGACDTFRAAAVEQLEVWCKRADVDIIKAEDGANPSGVAYETVEKAKEMNADYCIIDTAGRLHTATNLMDELAKTKRVMGKVIESAPHEVLLVLDAITGQNALKQAIEFNNSLNLTGLIFTKCDGSAKAGSAVTIVKDLKVPIIYIGVGESVEDLDRFDLDSYLNALLGIS